MSTEDRRGFFAENWPWIVVPFLLVVGTLATLMWMTGSSTDGDAAGEFTYHVF